MNKVLKLLVVFFSFFTLFCGSVKAYTKEDILDIANDIKTCSSETASLVNGTKASYTRMLNERNISNKDLDKIYNNILSVISILNKYSLCDVSQEESMSQSVKDKLYSLFEETNEIILSSPKIVNSSGNTSDGNSSNTDSEGSNSNESSNTNQDEITDSKIVIDSANNQIKIYENGILIDVIQLNPKLNYVGLNKDLVVSLKLMITLFLILVVLKFVLRKNVIITSLLYVLILVLPITYALRDKISMVLDTISLMSIKENTNIKDIVFDGEKIISYPSYGNKYATIYINNNEGDIYFGDDKSILKKGIGQANSSYLPGEGKTTILSGHNTGVFKELLKVKKDDDFIIETVYGKFTYNIEKIKIINDTNTSILSEDYDVIMYTCYPESSLYGNKRIAIFGNLVESKWVGGNSEK